MAVMKSAILAALALVFADAFTLSSLKHEGSPVDKVVELLGELKSSVEADGEKEQASYDKYACWCEDTLSKKAAEITKTKETIDKLLNGIPKLRGDIAAHQVEIKQLEKDIAANIASTREATEVRDGEAEAYNEEKEETEQCVGALEAAIHVLSFRQTGKKFLESLQEAQLLSVVAGVRSILQHDKVPSTISNDDVQVVKQFVDKPEEFVGESRGYLSAAQIASNPYGDYSPRSKQVQGILKGMYDSFTLNLEKANAEEAEKQKSFEDIMKTKKMELDTLQSTLDTQTADEARKTKKLAEMKTQLDDLKEQLAADEKFFALTKSTCKTKAHQWSARTRVRTEELTAIAQAIEILSSDEAKATFKNATTTFLQISATKSISASEQSVGVGAYMQLKEIATKYQSMQLAKLAVMAKSQTQGHFDKVIAAVDQQISTLRDEERDDIADRDFCEGKTMKNKHDMEDLQHAVDKAKDDIDRMEDDAKDLEDKIKEVDGRVNDTQDELEELKQLRVDERNKHIQAVQADSDAVILLEEAAAKLSKFYKSFLSMNRHVRTGGAPSPAAAKYADAPPDLAWSGDEEYTGSTTEGKGVVGMILMIKEDLEKEIKVGRKDDAEAQAMYEEDRAGLVETLDAQIKTRTEYEKALAGLEVKIADKEELKSQKGDDLDSETTKKGNLKNSCKWVKDHFDDRRDGRKKEIAGLIEAKGYLAGIAD